MFSFYQIHPRSINKTADGSSSEDGVTAKVSETTCHQSIQHGTCLSIGAKLPHKAHPKTPRCLFVFDTYFNIGHIWDSIHHGMSSILYS